jgi:hypothetical protein
MNTIPTREDIAARLRDLIEGRQTKEEVSAWASTFVCDDDHPRISDRVAWETLKKLLIADAHADLDHYLYGETDFRKWLDDLLDD